MPSTSLDRELAGLRDQIARLTSENTRLLRLLELTPAQARPPGPTQTGIFDGPAAMVDAASSPRAKVDFFASMFAARSDVYAVRWENARTGRSGWMPAVRGGWRKGVAAGSREYLPLTADLLASHLSGDIDVGLYPLLDGEHGLLALDWHSGNRSVLVDHDLSGAIVGQTLATRAEDTYRALLEATAYGTRTLIETFNAAGVHVTELIIAGGLTKNALLMQIYADVTGMPLSVIGSSQGPALGSAIHAAVAAVWRPEPTQMSQRPPCRWDAWIPLSIAPFRHRSPHTTSSIATTRSCTTTSDEAPTKSCTDSRTAVVLPWEEPARRPPNDPRCRSRTDSALSAQHSG